MLGHGAVLTAVMGGGRTIADRQNLVAWGDAPVSKKSEAQPWPGQLPPPAPTTVFPIARQVSVTASSGEQVDLNDRGMLSGVPDRFSATNSLRDSGPVRAWAGPWPVDERWWDGDAHRAASRFQLVDADGTAWLLILEDHRWWAEARYD
jgi:protein ImuB